jgi:hypothetical protein
MDTVGNYNDVPVVHLRLALPLLLILVGAGLIAHCWFHETTSAASTDAQQSQRQ